MDEEELFISKKEYDKQIVQNNRKINKFRKKFSRGLKKEIKINQDSKEYDFKVIDDETWLFTFVPKQGLFKNQKHQVKMKLIYGQPPYKQLYPLNAPLCSYITPVWHPNISLKGTICLDTLKEKWSPCMKTANVIQAIQVLLDNPDPSSPMNAEAAKMGEDEYAKKVIEHYIRGPN